MPSITFSGTLNVQLTDESRPTPVPLAFTTAYAEKSLVDFAYATAQSHVALPMGTVTAPKLVLVQVTQGAVALSTDDGGLAPWNLAANASPPPGDVPFLLLFNYPAGASALYVTTTGPASGRIWLFE